MRLGRVAFFACAAATALSATVPARAQEVPGSNYSPRVEQSYGRALEPEVSAWDRLGLHGLELQLRGFLAYAGDYSPVQAHSLYAPSSSNPTGAILNPASCPPGSNPSCSPYGIDAFAPGVSLGWRVRSRISVGAFFSYYNYNSQNGTDVGDANDGTSQLNRVHWVLGAYGRYYFTWVSRKLQPWVELGFGYSDDEASYDRTLGMSTMSGPEPAYYKIGEKGLAVPVTLGLDWRLAPIFSVGPIVGYETIFPLQGCVDVEPNDPTSPVQPQNTCARSVVQSSVYGVFFAGVQVKVTIVPAPR
jgi:hypothetical protein